MEVVFFMIFAIVAVASATAVVSVKNPVHSSLFLILCLLQVAALFVLLRAPFIAVVQVFIYVGAVMVLFLFVVLLLDIKKITMQAVFSENRTVMLVVVAAVLVEFVTLIALSPFSRVVPKDPGAEVLIETIGKVLFTQYLFPFEVVSLVLLVAMVGAIVMTMERGG